MAEKPESLAANPFGRTAIRLGFLNSRQLSAALDRYRHEKSAGSPRRIGEVMVDMGLLTPDQVKKVLYYQSKVILSCAECGARYNVRRIDRKRALEGKRCTQCGGVLEEGEPEAGLSAEDDADSTRPPPSAVADVEEEKEDVFASLIGRVVGNCRIEEKVGEGGMGVVYRATHTLLKRRVALKVLPKALNPNEEKIARFFSEAESLGTLASPHIVQIFNVGEEPGFYFIEMEFVAGGDLDEVIASQGRQGLDEALPVMKQIASGLRDAHEKNIVHRDLKPANILITTEGKYKLADFGLAKSLEGTVELTQDGAVMGTPTYMSPEQCRGDTVDLRSDVYSLGSLFYYMLTGKKPFESENPMVVVMKHMNEEVRPPTDHVPDLPRSYSNLVERMMAKKPEERYQDADEVMQALQDIEKGVEVAYTARRVRRRRFRIALSAALLVLFGGAVFAGTQIYLHWIESQKKALRTSPKEKAEALVSEARALFASGEFARAIPKSREALELIPGLEGAEDLLARAETLKAAKQVLGAGDARKADDLLASYEKDHPADSAAAGIRKRARLLLEAEERAGKGDWRGAADRLAALMEIEPDHNDAKRRRKIFEALTDAEALQDSEGPLPALQSLGSVFPIAPADENVAAFRRRLLDALLEKVDARLEERQLDKAQALVLKVLEAVPGAGAFRRRRARIDTALAQFDEMIRAGEKKAGEQDWEAALRFFSKADEVFSPSWLADRMQNARYRLALARAREAEDAHRFEQARALYRSAKRYAAEPGEVDAFLAACSRRRAEVLVDRAEALLSKNLARAETVLAEAIKAWPDRSPPPGARDLEAEIARRRNLPEGFVYVPQGRYPVGRPDAESGGRVDVLLDPFYIASAETTNREFKAFVDAGGYENEAFWDEAAWGMRARFRDRDGNPGPGLWTGGSFPSGTGHLPVVKISWYEARAFARFSGGRLPSREEWMAGAGYEPASDRCRPFPWGDDWKPDAANLWTGEGEPQLAPVRSFPLDRSPLGCFDMAGNASEWTDTPFAEAKDQIVVKGGSYRHNTEAQVRVFHDKARAAPGMRWPILGFRIVKEPPAHEEEKPGEKE